MFVIFYFFFFKQKTAYEMRISDWSSDVCSSDLAVMLMAGAAGAQDEDIRFFRIGTGTTGGTYFPIGGIIANAISNPPGSPGCERGGSCGVPGLIAVAQARSGSGATVENIGKGEIAVGMRQADVVHGGIGRAWFRGNVV